MTFDPTKSDRELHHRALVRAAWGTVPAELPPPPDPAPLAVAPTGRRARRSATRLLTLLLFGVWLVGCGNHHQGVVLWHAYNGAERTALESTAAQWNAQHPEQELELVAVPYGAFADKLTSAIPGGNGPDLFIYPQDRIGDWADSGVIEPIEFWLDDKRVERFTNEAIAAMAYKGSLWGLPVTVKSLALYYRTDLVETPPASTDELLALAPRMHARDGYAIAYANVDLYGHAPWLFGYGGKIMDDTGKLAIATPEAASAMAFARKLVVDGVVRRGHRVERALEGRAAARGQRDRAPRGSVPWRRRHPDVRPRPRQDRRIRRHGCADLGSGGDRACPPRTPGRPQPRGLRGCRGRARSGARRVPRPAREHGADADGASDADGVDAVQDRPRRGARRSRRAWRAAARGRA
ncbi:MAG: extracellular solute-binding protein family 1 [Deltaproteobacteria bacterium]|nr:extracellular solute-binding protein family 1 [Deltaproteobacteria bacterium]